MYHFVLTFSQFYILDRRRGKKEHSEEGKAYMRELISRREISMLESGKDELMLAGCNQSHDLRMLSIHTCVWCFGNSSFSLDGILMR